MFVGPAETLKVNPCAIAQAAKAREFSFLSVDGLTGQCTSCRVDAIKQAAVVHDLMLVKVSSHNCVLRLKRFSISCLFNPKRSGGVVCGQKEKADL